MTDKEILTKLTRDEELMDLIESADCYDTESLREIVDYLLYKYKTWLKQDLRKFLEIVVDVCFKNEKEYSQILEMFDYRSQGLHLWDEDSETKKYLEEYGILEIAKKFSFEFKKSIKDYVGNYYDCGWIRVLELNQISIDEIRTFEKEISSIAKKYINEVPCSFESTSNNIFNKESRNIIINRYEKRITIKNYDKNNILVSKEEKELDIESTIAFFSLLRQIKADNPFCPLFDYNESVKICYPSHCIDGNGLVNINGNALSSYDLFNRAKITM